MAEIHAPPQAPFVGHVIVGVQVDPFGQPVSTPTVQGICAGGVGLGIQRPRQTTVCVHVKPVGQSFAPSVHGIVGSGAGLVVGGEVTMHAPPQFPVAGQTMVGVQVAPAGQPVWAPTVQGIWGTGVNEDMQRPPQTEVWVQMEPVGQGSPPTVQETVNDGPGVVDGEEWRAASVSGRRGRRENRSMGFILLEGKV